MAQANMGNRMRGVVSRGLRNAGAPTAGTSGVQTITLAGFNACTVQFGFMGATANVTFTGSEDNTAIGTAVTAALEGLVTIGTGNVTVAVTGTTDRAIAVTFAADLSKFAVDTMTASVVGDVATVASLTTALTGTNNDLTYTAVTPGAAGNGIKIIYADPGANDGALSVGVSGTTITATLATDGSGAITSTGSTVAAAIAAKAEAAALVTVANATGNDGTGVVTALSQTALTGGTDPTAATVAVTTAGVTATGRGAATGSRLVDTTNGVDYINTGTPLAPTWTKTGTQS